MVLYMYPTSFPYPEGGSRVYRIGEDGSQRSSLMAFNLLTWTSIKMAICWLYSTLMRQRGRVEGSLIQVAPDGTRTTLISAGEGIKSVLPLVLVLMVLFMSQTKAMSQEKGKYQS